MLKTTTVKDWMTAPVMSVSPSTPMPVARDTMKEWGIRHLPVVENDKLVGMLSFGDIREASPSDATSLSVWELNYLSEKVTVKQVMSTHVVSVHPDDAILDAIRQMLSHRIGSLAVVDSHGRLVGIITETDVFRMVLEVAEQEHA